MPAERRQDHQREREQEEVPADRLVTDEHPHGPGEPGYPALHPFQRAAIRSRNATILSQIATTPTITTTAATPPISRSPGICLPSYPTPRAVAPVPAVFVIGALPVTAFAGRESSPGPVHLQVTCAGLRECLPVCLGLPAPPYPVLLQVAGDVPGGPPGAGHALDVSQVFPVTDLPVDVGVDIEFLRVDAGPGERCLDVPHRETAAGHADHPRTPHRGHWCGVLGDAQRCPHCEQVHTRAGAWVRRPAALVAVLFLAGFFLPAVLGFAFMVVIFLF